ncbi:MAG TPA: PhoH family protein [Pseudogracilibacillus sp.]|nr:PhoH family protein [Pseudogracilibacillus sp.]
MPENLIKVEIELSNNEDTQTLFGANDYYLKLIEEQLDVSIVSRGQSVNVSGEKKSIQIVEDILNSLLKMIQKGIKFTERDILYAIELAKENKIELFETLFDATITKNVKGKTIRAKTLGQKEYIQAMRKNDLVFGIGPAGTGKTYLAVVFAVHALKTGAAKRIVLTRPAVEAGESLGFLPGDLKEKVDPYLRPLYDALNDVLGRDQTLRLIDNEVIEIAPLAYMRGRTLDNAYVILDEAQNTTPEQMKMFLTRLGFGSKMVVTGDITQVDLPKGVKSGLAIANEILKDIKGIKFIHLTGTDVVRHPLVQKIIRAYDAQ